MRVVQHKQSCTLLLRSGYKYRLELEWDGFRFGGSISYRTVSSQQEAIKLVTMHMMHVERIDERDLLQATLWLRPKSMHDSHRPTYKVIEWLPDND